MLAILSWKSLWGYQMQVHNNWLNIQCPTEKNVGKSHHCAIHPQITNDTKQEKRRGKKQNFKKDLHEKNR